MSRRWEAYLRVSGWTSEYKSVGNFLRYLRYRKTGSKASRDIYGRTLYALCRHTDKLPEELVEMKKADIEKLVEEFCYHKREKQCCNATVNTTLFMIKTFFKVNGFRELEVESYYQPARARTREEYIPTLDEARRMASVAGSLRDRAIIFVLVSTGLRNSTLRAILYRDVREELEQGRKNILIRVHFGMKKVDPSACKGKIEYFVFTSAEATQAIELYLDERRRRFGEIQDNELLFPSEHNRLPARKRKFKPLSARELQILVKKVARKAGIKEWKKVTPTCLRKTFNTVLHSPLADNGRLDWKTQEYFTGHILPGSMDTYYDKGNVDELRKEYQKLVFTPFGRGRFEGSGSLRIVAEILTQLAEHRQKELGRNLNEEDQLHLLQEAFEQAARQLREVNLEQARGRVPSLTERSEPALSTQSISRQTQLVSVDNTTAKLRPDSTSSKGRQTCKIQTRKSKRAKSVDLTSHPMPQESKPLSDGQRTKAKTDLLSFL